jgi:hypothetical protein
MMTAMIHGIDFHHNIFVLVNTFPKSCESAERTFCCIYLSILALFLLKFVSLSFKCFNLNKNVFYAWHCTIMLVTAVFFSHCVTDTLN